MRRLILALAALPVLACTARAACLPYEPATITLSGTIEKHVAFGPPGYGETPKVDKREDFTGLRLYAPACTIPGDEDQPGERNIRMMQMVFDGAYPKLPVGYKVKVTGTLEHATSGHHHTPVLVQVKTFE